MDQPTARNHATRGTHKHSAQMTLSNPQRHMVPAVVLTRSKSVPITAFRPVSIVVLKISVTRPRQATSVVTKSKSPLRRHINQEPKRVHQALKDPSWIEAMQEELLQFKMQKVWVLVDLPHGKRAIGTKWVFRNKKDERGIVVRNKARLLAQGHTQKEGIDYVEFFTQVAKIEAIRLFLAYASFMGFMVYQMDVKSDFLYGTIEEEIYVCQPSEFEDPDHPDKVYKVVKALYGLHQALRACQDRYVAETLGKFGLTDGKSASTPINTKKPLLKDLDGVNTPRCDEDMLELMKLTVFLLPSDEKVGIGFWTTVIVKKVNDVMRLQALVDKKKVNCDNV
nr:putative ribonuclease H-like domain-containing protein [Tanacetum cinerariifolium]